MDMKLRCVHIGDPVGNLCDECSKTKGGQGEYRFSDELLGRTIIGAEFSRRSLMLHFTDGKSLLLRVTKMVDGKEQLVPFTVMGSVNQ